MHTFKTALALISNTLDAKALHLLAPMKPMEVVQQGEPTGVESLPTHTFSLVAYDCSGDAEHFDDQLRYALGICEKIQAEHPDLSGQFRMELHCRYQLGEEGGLSLYAEQIKKMAELGIGLNFNVIPVIGKV